MSIVKMGGLLVVMVASMHAAQRSAERSIADETIKWVLKVQ